MNCSYPIKRIGTLHIILASLLLGGCDPAITIRQMNPPSRNSTQIVVHVKTQHPMIGNTWYVPQIAITNGSDSPIKITSLELATKQRTYANKPRHLGSYPLEVGPGKTETLDTWFELSDDVRKTFFRQPAELLIHYRCSNGEETAHISIIGGPLDTSSP